MRGCAEAAFTILWSDAALERLRGANMAGDDTILMGGSHGGGWAEGGARGYIKACMVVVDDGHTGLAGYIHLQSFQRTSRLLRKTPSPWLTSFSRCLRSPPRRRQVLCRSPRSKLARRICPRSAPTTTAVSQGMCALPVRRTVSTQPVCTVWYVQTKPHAGVANYTVDAGENCGTVVDRFSNFTATDLWAWNP